VPIGGAATREYFPRSFRGAIRQRTRWVTGIALQSWARHGWRGKRAQKYWFWRDRKGLLGNPVGLLANLLFITGLVCWATGRGFMGQHMMSRQLLWVTFAFQVERLAVRFVCTARLYGIGFALGVPLRAFVANYVNAVSSIRALWVYGSARLQGQPLVWLKTEHAYPSRNALAGHRRKLGEVLAGSGYISEDTLAKALRAQPAGVRLGRFLVERGEITEEELYEALSLQQSVPAGELRPDRVDRPVTRLLPRWVVRDWKILPYQISSGNLFLASPEVPSDEMTQAVRGFTRLSLRFRLVTPANFESLVRQLLC